MKEIIKVVLTAGTLVTLLGGFYLTINQVRSNNEIRLENNRTNIIASTEPTVLISIVNSYVANGDMEAKRKNFLRAMFSHYTNVYRIDSYSVLFSISIALSDSYVADASHGFCWWLKHDMAKGFWNDAVAASEAMKTAGKLRDGTDLSAIESEWCGSAKE